MRPQRRRLGRRPGVELVPGDVSRCVHRGTLGSAAPQDAAGTRGDGRAAPEATPTDEILAALREPRERVPNSAAVVDQTIVALEDLRAEVSGLRYALTSRTTIDEAKGIIMAERGCDEDTAFLILVLMSQDTNVPLRDVARAVVYRATGDE